MGDAFHGEKKTLGCFARGVIATMGGVVFLALLYPVFATAPGGHAPTQCMSKLKQLASTQLIYSQDNNDCLPPFFSFEGQDARESFVAATYPYSKNGLVYVCPFAPESKLESQFAKPVLGYQHFPLILRRQVSLGAINLSLIKEPAKDVWMHDSIVKLEVKSDGEHVETHHGPGKSGFFVSFFDSHARWIPTTSGPGKDWINTIGVWQK